MRILKRQIVRSSQAFFAAVVVLGSPIAFAQVIKLHCEGQDTFLLNIDTARRTVGIGGKTDRYSLSQSKDTYPGMVCVNQIYEWNDAFISWGRKCSDDGGPFRQIGSDTLDRISGKYKSTREDGPRFAESQCKLFDPTKKLF